MPILKKKLLQGQVLAKTVFIHPSMHPFISSASFGDPQTLNFSLDLTKINHTHFLKDLILRDAIAKVSWNFLLDFEKLWVFQTHLFVFTLTHDFFSVIDVKEDESVSLAKKYCLHPNKCLLTVSGYLGLLKGPAQEELPSH